MATVPVLTKEELLVEMIHENVELHKKIHVLEAQLEEEHKKRVHAEGLCDAWEAKWKWDCEPNRRLGAWD